MSTETIRLIRNGRRVERGYGGWGRGRLYIYQNTVTTRMTPALRWAAIRAFLVFHSLWGTKSQDRVHKPQLLKRKESRSGIEPRSFRLPLGQTGSLIGSDRPLWLIFEPWPLYSLHEMWKREHWSARKTCQPWRLWLQKVLNNTSAYCISAWCGARCHWLRTRPHDSGTDKFAKGAQSAERSNVNHSVVPRTSNETAQR